MFERPPSNKPTGSDDTVWAAICHIAALVATCCCLNWLIPIVILFVKKDSPFVVSQAKEVLNFQISVILWALISFALCFVIIGIPMLLILAACALILPLVGAIQSAGGTDFRYPLTFRIVK